MTSTTAPPPGSPHAAVEVVESWPARIHRPLDLVRLLALVGVLLLLTVLTLVGRDTSRGVAADLTRLLHHVPRVFDQLLRLVSAFGALALPLALMVREVVRGYRRRLIEAVLTGLLAIGVAEGIDRIIAAFPTSELYAALAHLPGGTAARPLDTYLTALFAFAAVIGVGNERPWRRLLIGVTTVYVLSAFLAAHATLQSLIVSLTLGLLVGIAVRYVAGSVNERPDGARVAGELRRQGVALVRLEEVPPETDYLRVYRGTTADGEQFAVQVYDRELIASGAIYNVWRLIRLRAELAPAPSLSLERVAEHRTLLAMAAQAIGVPAPRLVAGVPCGPDAIVLVYDVPAGTPLEQPTDAQLDELWRVVNTMHFHRMTHRGLSAGKILAGPSGSVVLPAPTNGAMFAGDLRLSLDRVQLLITTAQLADVERAVRSARRNLTDDELAAVLPVLQPIALPSATRHAVKEHKGLLDAVRAEIQRQTNQRPPELANVERLRPRAILSIVAVIVAAYLIVGQLSSVNLATVMSGARWQWVPLVVGASALTYVAAAVSLTGYVREKLSFGRTLLAQVAASFAGFVTPPAVGGLALNVRYLQKSGVPTAGIATSLGLSQAVNAASHIVLLIAFAAATGATSNESLPVPGWAFGVLGGLAVLALLGLAIPAIRHWVAARALPPMRQSVARLLDLVTTPLKLVEALGGALLLNAAYIAALWFSVHAFNGTVGVAGAAVVYLTSAAIGSVAPTPGGLGAVELALATGLAAAGMASTAAVSGVLLFRLATFWLPVPVGWLALQVLRRQNAV